MYNLERKGRTLNFSDLGDSVADKLYSGRMRIKKALEELPIGAHTEQRRWKNACAKSAAWTLSRSSPLPVRTVN